MATPTYLLDQESGGYISSRDFYGMPFEGVPFTSPRSLEVVDVTKVHGTFVSVTRIAAGTSQLVLPNSNGSILITDLLISGEKKPSASTEVTFTDGTNEVVIFLASANDAPVTFSHSFGGRFQGWRDARIDVTTVQTVTSTVTVGYTKIPKGLPFAEWDAHR